MSNMSPSPEQSGFFANIFKGREKRPVQIDASQHAAMRAELYAKGTSQSRRQEIQLQLSASQPEVSRTSTTLPEFAARVGADREMAQAAQVILEPIRTTAQLEAWIRDTGLRLSQYGMESAQAEFAKVRDQKDALENWAQSFLRRLSRIGGPLVAATGLALLFLLVMGQGSIASAATLEAGTPAATRNEDGDVDADENDIGLAVATTAGSTGGRPKYGQQTSQAGEATNPITATASISETGKLTETLDIKSPPLSITLNATGTLYAKSGQRVSTIAAGRSFTATHGLSYNETTGILTAHLDLGSYITITSTNTFSNPLEAVAIGNLDNLPAFVFNGREVSVRGEDKLVQITTNASLNLRSKSEAGDNQVRDASGNLITVAGTFTATLETKKNGDVWGFITDPTTGESGWVAVRVDGEQLAQTDEESGVGGPISTDWPGIIVRMIRVIPQLKDRLSIIYGAPNVDIPPETGVVVEREPAVMLVATPTPGSQGSQEVLAVFESSPEGTLVIPLTENEQIVDAIRQALSEAGTGEVVASADVVREDGSFISTVVGETLPSGDQQTFSVITDKVLSEFGKISIQGTSPETIKLWVELWLKRRAEAYKGVSVSDNQRKLIDLRPDQISDVEIKFVALEQSDVAGLEADFRARGIPTLDFNPSDQQQVVNMLIPAAELVQKSGKNSAGSEGYSLIFTIYFMPGYYDENLDSSSALYMTLPAHAFFMPHDGSFVPGAVNSPKQSLKPAVFQINLQ